jgi:hypothetical protein
VWFYVYIYIYTHTYNIQVHIRKKEQQTVQNMLSCITSKIPEQNIYQAAVIWVILLELHELQVIQKQYFCRKMYSKTWLHPSHNLKALFYYISVHNLHYNTTAETKTACYKMCTSYSTIRMKVSWLPLYKNTRFKNLKFSFTHTHTHIYIYIYPHN